MQDAHPRGAIFKSPVPKRWESPPTEAVHAESHICLGIQGQAYASSRMNLSPTDQWCVGLLPGARNLTLRFNNSGGELSMASQLFREESKLKGLSGVKTEQGKAGLNVREIKQAESHRDGYEDRVSGEATAFYSLWQM